MDSLHFTVHKMPPPPSPIFFCCIFPCTVNDTTLFSSLGAFQKKKQVKVTVYSLLMNYSYEFFCFLGAENLMLAQISVIDCNSAPKTMSCSEKLEFIGQSDAFCG